MKSQSGLRSSNIRSIRLDGGWRELTVSATETARRGKDAQEGRGSSGPEPDDRCRLGSFLQDAGNGERRALRAP